MRVRIAMAFVATILMSHVAVATTLEEIEISVAKQWRDVTSFRADMVVDVKLVSLGIASVKSKGTGRVEFAVTDKGRLHRMQLTNRVKSLGIRIGTVSIMSLFDGEHQYAETIADGKTKVTKTFPREVAAEDGPTVNAPAGGEAIFDKLREQGDVTYVGEDKLKGVPVWVVGVDNIRRSVGDKEKAVDGSMQVYIGQESGLQLGMDLFDVKGKKVMEMRFSNVELNAEIDSSQFEYTPPTDAEFTDETAASLSEQ